MVGPALPTYLQFGSMQLIQNKIALRKINNMKEAYFRLKVYTVKSFSLLCLKVVPLVNEIIFICLECLFSAFLKISRLGFLLSLNRLVKSSIQLVPCIRG